MDLKTTPTWWAKIYMAGDIALAKNTCRNECLLAGLCVTIEPTTYIYTGGEEQGFIVGLINYPRFPAKVADIEARAEQLGMELMHACAQLSFSIMTPAETRWFSRRESMEAA